MANHFRQEHIVWHCNQKETSFYIGTSFRIEIRTRAVRNVIKLEETPIKTNTKSSSIR